MWTRFLPTKKTRERTPGSRIEHDGTGRRHIDDEGEDPKSMEAILVVHAHTP